jgi:hypothetical protein
MAQILETEYNAQVGKTTGPHDAQHKSPPAPVCPVDLDPGLI